MSVRTTRLELMVTALTTQALLLVIAFAILVLLAFAVAIWLGRRALRGESGTRRITFGLATAVPIAVIAVAVWLVVAITEARPSDRVLAAVTQVHPQFRALIDPAAPPEGFPPIESTATDGAQPGTVLLSTFTSPRMPEGATFYPPFVTEIDKATGDIVKTQRMYSNATMFQPEPGDRYSYNVVTKNGRDGAGFEVTHYVTDDRLNVLEQFDLSDLQGGDADLHDFVLLDNGNALLMAYRERQIDLTEFGGPANGLVYDTVLAERTPDGETVWLWDGAEHMDLADVPAPVAEDEFTKQPPAVADYAHPNSFDVFDDGDVLVSIRHYDCLYRIDRDTGDIVWTFGGPNCVNNEFEISGDPHDGFSHQHDATILDNGNILLFDNGNLREGPVSRVVEYAVDEDARTAELVWSYDDGRYTAIMGSAERLANGNTLIGWGQLAERVITEVTADGEEVFSLSVPPGQLVYRAYQGAQD